MYSQIFKNSKLTLIIILCVCFNTISFAQEIDTTSSSVFKPKRDFKNSVKFNITNTLLYDNSYQLSYERIIKKNQTINVFAGYQQLPLITVDLGEARYNKDHSRTGYSAGADYRFYLGDINKYNAPRGVYLAPFVSYFQFKTDRGFEYTNSETGIVNSSTLVSKLSLTSVGGELGYQFVLWDRFVIDCVLFGPSMSYYKFNVKADADLPGIDDNEVAQKVIDAIKDKFPSLGDITDKDGSTKSGVQSITAIGFRYNICIGYRF